jgi:hypothetical protein
MQLQLGLVLAMTAIAGIWGWRRTRRRWRSLYDEKPVGMSDADYERRVQRRYLFRRLANGALYAAIDAALGWGIGRYLHLS